MSIITRRQVLATGFYCAAAIAIPGVQPAMAQAREAGIHFVAAGHYATEVFGVRALGDLVAGRFGVDHVFVDVPNPI